MKKSKKHEKEHISRAGRISNRISELEEETKTLLEETNLINRIKFRYNTDKNEYSIEYKSIQPIDEKPHNCRLLRNLLFEKIACRDHPEIKGIDYRNPYPETYVANLIINPAADIYNPDNFIIDVLTDIKRCLEVYNKRK
jgi:hypothetical protein